MPQRYLCHLKTIALCLRTQESSLFNRSESSESFRVSGHCCLYNLGVAYIILGEVKAVHSIFSFLTVVMCVVIIVLF